VLILLLTCAPLMCVDRYASLDHRALLQLPIAELLSPQGPAYVAVWVRHADTAARN
jgi:hypothetical protein